MTDLLLGALRLEMRPMSTYLLLLLGLHEVKALLEGVQQMLLEMHTKN